LKKFTPAILPTTNKTTNPSVSVDPEQTEECSQLTHGYAVARKNTEKFYQQI